MKGELNPELLIELVTKPMPYGKYKGVLYYQLPVNYLEWFNRKGFPPGKNGILLATIYEIKLNGLEFLLHKIKASLSDA
jgi:uncharacterized protein